MDRGASVLAKLKAKSKQTGNSLQMHLQLFCQEEFLRRLALSKYADNLVLKGGLFIYTLTNFESRATVDVDFLLRQLPNSVVEMEKIITEILAVDTGNNFIEFTAGAFESISPQRKIPVQLEDFTQPEISTYSLESTIAEKFDAMLQRLEMTSRMKDFYDIYYLSKMFDFDGRKLQEAIAETLQNRGTSYNRDSLQQIAGFIDDAEMVAKWKRALKDIKKPDITFDEVVGAIVNFLNPVWQGILDEEEFFLEWTKSEQKWIRR